MLLILHGGIIQSDQKVSAPDDYNTEVRCTETFWSPCIFQYMDTACSEEYTAFILRVEINKFWRSRWLYRCFHSPRGPHFYISTYFSNLTHFHSENGGSIFPWNAGIYQYVQFHKPVDYSRNFHCCLNVKSYIHQFDWSRLLYCEKQCASNSEYEYRNITCYQYC
jgi:hypothetical protein